MMDTIQEITVDHEGDIDTFHRLYLKRLSICSETYEDYVPNIVQKVGEMLKNLN